MDNFNYASCACFEGKNIFLAWTLVWENNFKKKKKKKKIGPRYFLHTKSHRFRRFIFKHLIWGLDIKPSLDWTETTSTTVWEKLFYNTSLCKTPENLILIKLKLYTGLSVFLIAPNTQKFQKLLHKKNICLINYFWWKIF